MPPATGPALCLAPAARQQHRGTHTAIAARQADTTPASGLSSPPLNNTEEMARHLIHRRSAGSGAAPQPMPPAPEQRQPEVHGLDHDDIQPRNRT